MKDTAPGRSVRASWKPPETPSGERSEKRISETSDSDSVRQFSRMFTENQRSGQRSPIFNQLTFALKNDCEKNEEISKKEKLMRCARDHPLKRPLFLAVRIRCDGTSGTELTTPILNSLPLQICLKHCASRIAWYRNQHTHKAGVSFSFDI